MPSEREELIEIIKSSEVWKLSNYVGRDKSFFGDKNGTDKLADAILEWHRDKMDEEDCVPSCQEVAHLKSIILQLEAELKGGG